MRLVGREREANEFVRLLSGGARLISVTGRAGVGKSAYLAAIARSHSSGRRLLTADLTGSPEGSPLLDALARSLGIAAGRRLDAGAAAIAASVGRQQALLLIDHVEGLIGAPDLGEIISLCPGLVILVASRSAVPGSVALELRPFPVPSADDDIERVRSNPGVLLFAERAVRSSAQFELDDETARSVGELSRLVGGLPLAIELAAARVSMLTPAQLVRLLSGDSSRNLDVLTGRPTGSAPLSVRDALATTMRDLSRDEHQLLAALAGFAGPVPFSAVLGSSSIAAADAMDSLQRLVDIRLVEPYREGLAEPAFDLLPIVRSFVRERHPDDDRRASRRHQVMADLLFDAAHALEAARPSDSISAARVLRRDLMREARRLLTIDALEATRWLVACAPVLADSAEIVEVAALMETVLASGAVEALPRELAARAWMWSSQLLTFSPDGAGLGEVVALRRERAAALIDAHASPYLDLQLRLVTVLNFVSTGDLALAVDAAEGGARAAHELGDPVWSARFEVWLASAAHATGDVPRALELARGALDRAQRVQDPYAIVIATVLLRTLPRGSVPAGTAIPPLEVARDLARSRGEPMLERFALTALASEELAADRPRVAAMWLAELFTHREPAGWLLESQIALVLAALIAEALGDHAFTARMLGAVRADLDRTLRAMAPHRQESVCRAFVAVERRFGTDRATQLIGASGALPTRDAIQEAAAWLRAHSSSPPLRTEALPLTPREADVLAVLAEGHSNKEIAARLGMSAKTVMHHSVAIYRKLEVRGRAEATAVAHRRGLILRPGGIGTAE